MGMMQHYGAFCDQCLDRIDVPNAKEPRELYDNVRHYGGLVVKCSKLPHRTFCCQYCFARWMEKNADRALHVKIVDGSGCG